MPALTPTEDSNIRSFPQHTEKFLSIAPRVPVFQGQVTTPTLYDGVSGGYYGLHYTGATGDPYACVDGMTVDVGSAPGLADIGSVRLRRGVDATAQIVYISETPYGDLPLAGTSYFTVYEEYRPANRLIRLEAKRTNGSQFVNDFTEYHDYNVPYSDQNTAIEPVVALYSQMTPAGLPVYPQLAGYVGPSGYRYVELRLSASLLGTGSLAYSWEIKDCVLVAGSLTSNFVGLNVPVGFRYVRVYVANGSRNRVRYIPLWAHGDSYPAMGEGSQGFEIKSDNTSDGRDMEVTIFGTGINTTVVPKGTLFCYWENAYFNGTSVPSQYRNQFWGWSKEESASLGEYGELNVKIAGIATWLKEIKGFGTQITDTGGTPRVFYEMQNITLDKMVHYLLREYSTVLNMCNLYLSNESRVTQSEKVNANALWSALQELAQAYGVKEVRADSNNSIWLRPHYSYLGNGTFGTSNERSSIQTITTITSDDIVDADSIEIGESYQKPIGRSDGTGDSWVSGSKEPNVYASRAPSKSSGQGNGTDDLPFQRLPLTDSQNELNWLVGQHYTRKNSPRQTVNLKLIGMMDVFEPAWGEVVRFNFSELNVRGLSLDEYYVLREVSVDHASERGGPRKEISLSLEKATAGYPGITVEIPKGDWVENPMWDAFWDTNPAMPELDNPNDNSPLEEWEDVVLGFALAFDKDSSKIGRTFNFTAISPNWENITPASPSGFLVSGDARMNGDFLQCKVAYLFGNVLRIYSTPDALSDFVVWTLELTATLAGTGTIGSVALRASWETDLWVFAWLLQDGVRVLRKSGVGSWDVSPTVVGSSSVLDTDATTQALGLDIIGSNIACCGKDALGVYRVYHATGTGSFTQNASVSNYFNSPINLIKWGRDTSRLYASCYETGETVSTVNNGGWSDGTWLTYSPTAYLTTRYTNFAFDASPTNPWGLAYRYQNQRSFFPSLAGTEMKAVFNFTKSPKLTSCYVPFDALTATYYTGAASPLSGVDLTIDFTYEVYVACYTDIGVQTRNYTVHATKGEFAFITVIPGPQFQYQFNVITTEVTGNDAVFSNFLDETGQVAPFLLRRLEIQVKFLNDLPLTPPEAAIPSSSVWTVGINKPVLNWDVHTPLYSSMYRVEDPFSTNSWWGIMQEDGHVVSTNLGLSVNSGDTAKVDMASIGPTGTRQLQYRSSSGSKIDSTVMSPPIRGIRTAKGCRLIWGDDLLSLYWKQQRFESKMGDWATVIGAGPNFENVICFL